VVHACIAARIRANVEALNMTETIGNVSRHRRAPYVIRENGEGFRLIYVPAISGESLAHAFQANLVEAAKVVYAREGLEPPLDEWSLRGEFIKFGDSKHLTAGLNRIIKEKMPEEEKQHEFEKAAIKESIVADVGGFLYAENPPVRRTSPFQVGYATPVEDGIRETAIEIQMHARQVVVGIKSEEEKRKTEEERRQAQMIYYVETASTVYGLTACVDFDAIGRTSMVRVEDAVDDSERKRRIRAALLALALTLGQNLYGAKRTRFNPVLETLEAVAVVSSPLPFVPTAPQISGYAVDTVNRLRAYKELLEALGVGNFTSRVLAYNVDVPGAERASSMEELFKKLAEEVLR